MIQVVPAIIPITKEQLEEEINKVSQFAHLIQVDISDGVFTNTRTWPYSGRDEDYFEKLRSESSGWPKWEDVDIELHLMVQNPEEVLLDWIHTGVSAIIVHVEATERMEEIINVCKENEVSVGIAIKPSTDISKLEHFVSTIDFIQVMGSNKLGSHGVTLENSAVEMIKKLHSLHADKVIAIDIGVSVDTKDELVAAGATKLVSGSAILDADYPKEAYNELAS